MNCPKCDYQLRHMELQESLTIDLCAGCKGIWYDKGELGFQQEMERDVPELDKSQKTCKPTDYPCPRCDATLDELEYSEGEHLMIDRCPKCEGIFLDRGEIRKVEHIVAKKESFAARFARAMKDIDDRGCLLVGKKRI